MRKKYYCQDCGKELNENAKCCGTKRCHSCSAKQLYKTRKHPFIKLIGAHSWNYKGIEKLCYCKDCGCKISNNRKRCRCCESKRRIKLNITGFKKGKCGGKNNANYKHGLSKFPYTSEFSSTLKSEIRKRDNYKCQKCGLEEKELKGFFKTLDIHHIDYNKFNCNPNNLISLCRICNSNVNKDRDYWYSYFNYIICLIF